MAASDDIRALFDEYVFGFIRNDIAREIWLADRTELDLAAGLPVGRYAGGGNVLTALGLLSYTDLRGKQNTENRRPHRLAPSPPMHW